MMIRTYLVISLLFNLIFPEIASNGGAFATAVRKNEADIKVEVSDLNGIEIGSKVLNNGLVVGKVAFVEKNKNNFSVIGVDLQPGTFKTLPVGIIGMIKSPMTIDPVNRNTLLEFFAPSDRSLNDSSENIKRGSTVRGFSSFEEFWKADLGKISSSYERLSIS